MGNDISKAVEIQRQKMELEHESRKNSLENQKQKLGLEFEALKRDHELNAEKAKKHYELELKKANMNHQHKIAELIAQMKQSKFQAGKDLLLSYMETLNIIIRQNGTALENVLPLFEQLKNDKLPETLKDTIAKTAQKALEGYMDTQDLLDFARKEVEKLKLNQDEEFTRLLDYAVNQKIISDENRIYLLE